MGDWFKLGPGDLTGLAYSSGAGTLSPSAPAAPSVFDTGAGTGRIVFSNGPRLRFVRGIPEQPFNAEIELSVNVLDSDLVAATNPKKFGGTTAAAGIAFDSGKTMRFGRLAMKNAHGSELVELQVPLRTDYYTGAGWTANTSDTCTTLAASDLSLTPRVAGLTTTPTLTNNPIALSLSPTGADNTGSFDLLFDLSPTTGANRPWLLFDWDGDSAYDDSPSARATFGIFKGSDMLIYSRELY